MKDVFFFNIISVFFFTTTIFWYGIWSFDQVSCITSLLYNISHMISSHLYLYNDVLNDMNILFFSRFLKKNIHIYQII
jgi:hypothetical protein